MNYSDFHPDSKTMVPFPIRDKGTSEPITKAKLRINMAQ